MVLKMCDMSRTLRYCLLLTLLQNVLAKEAILSCLGTKFYSLGGEEPQMMSLFPPGGATIARIWHRGKNMAASASE